MICTNPDFTQSFQQCGGIAEKTTFQLFDICLDRKLCHLTADELPHFLVVLSEISRVSMTYHLSPYSMQLVRRHNGLNVQPHKDLVNFLSHVHVIHFFLHLSLEKRIHTVALLLQIVRPIEDGIPSRSSWRQSELWPYAGDCRWVVPVHCICPG